MLLLIGTTTTVSVALWLLNRLQYQDWITRRLSVWVSSALGVTVSFRSAIVPAWRNGAIRLKNVKIRCGPEHGKLGEDGSRDSNFTMYDLQIDQIDVALSLWRWMEDRGLISECSMRGVRGVVDRRQVWWDPDTVYLPEEHRSTHQPGYFNLDSLEIDDMLLTVHPWKNFRPITVSIYSANMPRFRDRWLLYDVLCANSVVGMYDGSLFTIHQAHQQISSSEKPPVNPSRVYGSDILAHLSSDIAPKTKPCRGRTTHVQIDNLNIDHVNLGVEGPIGWITSGRMNVSSLINFPDTEPNDNPAAAIKKLVDNISDSIDVVILPSMPDWSNPESSPSPMVRMMYHLDMVDSPLAREMHNRLKRRAERESQRRLEKQRQRTASWSQALAPVRTHQIASPLSPEPGAEDQDQDNTPAMAAHLPNVHEDPTAVHVDLQVEFNDIRASVPLSTPQLGHPLLSSVLVRPIVGYMNAHRTSLPMRCQLRLRSDDFDGAWSLWDSGSDNLITQGIGAAFAQLAQNERERNRRLKLIGIWSVAAVAKQVLRLVDFFYSRHGFFEHSSLSGEAEHT
ncbi:Mitochondrial distribution and morphology protein 31, mitochondrial precursor [Coemansia sp. RSA 1933]|nr:Mitochondrial distribution and morphology protein 31, mitochondrial precursor [Coemansia sp. RSA 1933]